MRPRRHGEREEYLFDPKNSFVAFSLRLAVADSSLPADSLFLGFLTSHHVPLGHIEGRGVAICIGGVFKQD